MLAKWNPRGASVAEKNVAKKALGIALGSVVVVVDVVVVDVDVVVDDVAQFNFVGRILGPRGMTAKQLEQETGCKIMVRGRGSMRDKKKVSSRTLRFLFVFIIIIIIIIISSSSSIIAKRKTELGIAVAGAVR